MAERALRIGVDGRELVGHTTGVGRFLSEVLRAWAGTDMWPHTIVVFVPAEPAEDLLSALGSRVTWIVVPAAGSGTWWEQWHLPRAARRARIDVFFAGAYTAPRLLRCPFVVAIYDVSYFAHPEWFGRREGMRRRWLTRLTTGRAHTIVTTSEFSADEIVRWLHVRRTRIAVVPAGAPPRRPSRGAAATSTVLYVGSLFNRRLIPELVRGFARAAGQVPDARLILVGDNRTSPRIAPRDLIAEAGLEGRAEWRAYVPDAELAALYASARVFVFLSTYEGFAMTPLEALAHGVPPVLLDTRVAREVYGDGAMFVTSDPASIGAALTTLLGDDKAHRDLLAAGDHLLDDYSWPRTADTIRRALERAAAGSS